MRLLCVVLSFLIAAPILTADDKKETKEVRLKSEIKVVDHRMRLTRRVHWLLDFSKSMNGSDKERLINIWKMAMRLQPDDAEIRVTIFSGTPSPYPKARWVKLPNKNKVDEIVNWLQGIKAEGSTFIGHSIHWAMEEDKDKDDITIFVITDGRTATNDNFVMAVETGIRDRGEKVPVCVVGIGLKYLLDLPNLAMAWRKDRIAFQNMQWVAAETGGNFLVEGMTPVKDK